MSRYAWRVIAIAAVALSAFGQAMGADQVSDPAIAWHDGTTDLSFGGQDTADGLGGHVALATHSRIVVASAGGSALTGTDAALGLWWQKSAGSISLDFPELAPIDLKLSAGGQMTHRYSEGGLAASSSGITAAIEATFKPANHMETGVVLSKQDDRAWHTEAFVTETLGRARAEARVSADQWGTETEVGGTPSAPSLVSTRLLAREKATASLRVPLDPVGLLKTSFNITGDWQRSRVEDPITHRARRLSGEKPYAAHIELVHTVTPTLDVGVRGEACGAVEKYTPGAVSVVQHSVDVGTFLRYRTGPFELDLTAKTAVAARTEATYRYQDTRADSATTQAGAREIGGSSLTLELKRRF